jgi:hypothetical protein
MDQFACDFGQSAFVGVGQPGRQLVYRNPRHLSDFDIFVGEFAAGESQKIVVHSLVHASAFGDEPVVDAAQCGEHLALDAGFLSNLSDGGLLGGFPLFDVAFGQRPQHPTAPVDASDQRGELGVSGSVDAVDDQTARGGLMDGAQLIAAAIGTALTAALSAALTLPVGFGSFFARGGCCGGRIFGVTCGVGGFSRLARGLPVARLDCRWTSSTTAATSAAPPSWFGLFALGHPSDSSWHMLWTLSHSPVPDRARVSH